MNEKKLSVILPVYNVEDYLERCIRTLEEQDIPRQEYEIIVVNDGSPDNSREIVIRLMEEFSNIVFIEQENRGVSMARNAGIDSATGTYVLFIDPDDYVLPNTFGNILQQVIQHKAEVAFLGYFFLGNKGEKIAEVLHPEFRGKVFNGIDAYFLSRGDGKVDPDRAWAILFNRTFIQTKNLLFTPKIPYLEDGELMARILCLAERCLFSGSEFYLRTTRMGSATNSNLFIQERSIDGFIIAALNLKRFQQNVPKPEQIVFLNQPIAKFVLLVVTPFIQSRNFKHLNQVLSRLKESGLGKLKLSGCNNYYRIEGFLYNVSPFLFLFHRAMKSPLLKFVSPMSKKYACKI
jgi:glycosyltransferase involved in cell wall biosynthesis